MKNIFISKLSLKLIQQKVIYVVFERSSFKPFNRMTIDELSHAVEI